eukprot:scaffold269082_cov44-Prasinocladus_malaysianus.AAC.1
MLNVQQQKIQALRSNSIVEDTRTETPKTLNECLSRMCKQREESRKQLEELFAKIHVSASQANKTNVDADSNIAMTIATGLRAVSHGKRRLHCSTCRPPVGLS